MMFCGSPSDVPQLQVFPPGFPMALALSVRTLALVFRGGQRVRVNRPNSDLHEQILIVMAPCPYFTGSRDAIQCFDSTTGYVWPFRTEDLERV
jgi:hypothetical protein